jgi:H+/Cl- antiporter ClcA
MKKTQPFVHYLFLGLLTGLILGVLSFFGVNSLVIATNAIAVKAGAPAPGPYDPPWAYALIGLAIGFLVPIVGAIYQYMHLDTTEETTPQQPFVMEIGPNLTSALKTLEEVQRSQGNKKQEDGPPAPT